MSVQTEITRLSNAKSAIKTAIGNKGVTVPSTTKLDGMATLIGQIPTGTDTSDATAAAGDILSGKTAYVKGSKVTGTITSQAAQTITPGTSNKTIAAGKYLSGVQTIKGDANLVAGNIKSGVSIFGVTGSYTEASSLSLKNGYYTDKGAIHSASSTNLEKYTSLFSVTPGQTLTVTFTNPGNKNIWFSVAGWSANGTWVSRTDVLTYNSNNGAYYTDESRTATFTVPSGVYFVSFMYRSYGSMKMSYQF